MSTIIASSPAKQVLVEKVSVVIMCIISWKPCAFQDSMLCCWLPARWTKGHGLKLVWYQSAWRRNTLWHTIHGHNQHHSSLWNQSLLVTFDCPCNNSVRGYLHRLNLWWIIVLCCSCSMPIDKGVQPALLVFSSQPGVADTGLILSAPESFMMVNGWGLK